VDNRENCGVSLSPACLLPAFQNRSTEDAAGDDENQIEPRW